MLVAGVLVPNMGCWLLVCWIPAWDAGYWFVGFQLGMPVAGLLVPAWDAGLLVCWIPAWDAAGCC